MKIMMKSALVVLLLACFSTALVEHLVIENDSRSVFHIYGFGYETGGTFEITINDFLLMVPHDFKQPADGKYNIAFVLQRSNSDGASRLEENTPATCYHQKKQSDDDVIISLASRHDWQTLKYTQTITVPGWYHLYFSNCEAGTQSGFKMDLVEYNLDEKGRKVYLSAGEASLPTCFFIIFALFVIEIIVWLVVLGKQKDNVKSIHFLMTLVIVLKIFTMLFESMRYHGLKYTGHSDGWTLLYHIFNFMKGMLMFTVIVLIGTGWSYLKPFLTDRDKQLMLAVLIVQGMVNIAMVVVDDTAPGSAGWLTWRDILHLLDMVCCCVILLPIVWSIRHLRTAATADGKAARNMAKLKNFRTFYLLVVSYVYFTRIIVFLLSATLPFEYTWLGTVFTEAAALAFYALTGWLFRPQPTNPYLAIGEDDGPVTEMSERP